MEIKKIGFNDNFSIKNGSDIRLKNFNSGFSEVVSNSLKPNRTCPIKRISKTDYIDLSTGEVKTFDNLADSRADNLKSVRQSIVKLSDLINHNAVKRDNVHWVTLTYRENMQDNKRLYSDFSKFFKRFRYKYKDYKIEYIAVAEPQARGAWHMHCLFFYDRKRPFISNKVLAELWGFGFVTIKKMPNIDNFGLYFSAYLTDIEFKQDNELGRADRLKVANVNGVSKRFIKGGRLKYYPNGMRLFRASKGIKDVDIVYSTFNRFDFGKEIFKRENYYQLESDNNSYTFSIQYAYYKNKGK